MKIIKRSWKKDEEESEEALRSEIKNITRFFVGKKEIKDFVFDLTACGRAEVGYALRKGGKLKYYCNLSNRSFAIGNGILVALDDSCWVDYENSKLSQFIISLIN